jgi:CheY-like chemotaxis protein
MTTVLIADACKPSLVMTSEVFKDKIAGTVVDVATTGKDALEYIGARQPDLCVVDFDLPDVDGATLIEAIRKIYTGPILLTAYPDKLVEEAVSDHLFIFNDASDWIRKPINFDELGEKIDRFLLDGFRIGRRFESSIATQLVAKAAGRGKRAPKVQGKVVNLSLGGACIRLEGQMKMKKAQELTMTLALPMVEGKAPTLQESRPIMGETKIKARVAWINSKGEVGLQFARLTDVQKKGLENYFRAHTVP